MDMIRSTFAFTALFLMLTWPAAAQPVIQPAKGSTLRAELLDAARPTFEADTSGPVEFVVRRLAVMGKWAFGHVKVQRPGGAPVDWSRTRYAEDATEGAFDPAGSFFLLQWIGGGWRLVEFATGPTDVAWEDWRISRQLPYALFTD
jgi:hypothetical protein